MSIKPLYKRMDLGDFRETFAGRAPCRRTIKKWIQSGELPGEQIGDKFYVHVDSHGNVYKGPRPDDSNPQFDRLVSGFMDDSHGAAA